jgi:SAM-dependent methyltransferase
MTDPPRKIKPTERFSSRVEDYIRCRPSYPDEVVQALEREAGIGPARTRVIDLGCGTGISAALFLAKGYTVTGVEPNAEMRQAAEARLGASPRFRIVAGSAEQTPLPDSSCELIAAAQAFHWFEPAATRVEMQRLLVEDGLLALLWNERRTEASAFLREYESILLQYAGDYTQVDHRNWSKAMIVDFFGPGGCSHRVFPNYQEFDLDGLIGRALSSSYVPGPGQPGHEQLMKALRGAFESHATGGAVRFEYDTQLYFGRLA